MRDCFFSNLGRFVDLLTSIYDKNHIRFKEAKATFYRFTDFHRVLDQRLLTTYFQPILQLNEGSPVGFEILNRPPASRWFPTTEKFYDFVGHSGQTLRFEQYCSEQSLKCFVSNLSGRPEMRNALLFLNVHPQTLEVTDPSQGEIGELLLNLGISPEQVIFELTEKQEIIDFKKLRQALDRYRSLGYRIAMDDAGAGYNSLKTLIHVQPDYIKIDRSLIDHIDTREMQQRMVELLMNFGEHTQAKLIAEGIERPEEVSYLQDLGIPFGQGYALGKPAQQLTIGELP